MIWRSLMYSGVACLTLGTWYANPQQGAYSTPLLMLGGCLIFCAWAEALARSISTHSTKRPMI